MFHKHFVLILCQFCGRYVLIGLSMYFAQGQTLGWDVISVWNGFIAHEWNLAASTKNVVFVMSVCQSLTLRLTNVIHTLAIPLTRRRHRLYIWHSYLTFKWHHEKYPSDLNVTFDLMLETFNLYYNSWTSWDKFLIFHMCIPYLKALLFIPIFYLVTFDLYI